jgi:hypothetical protein
MRDHSIIILPKGDRLTHDEILPRGCVVAMSSKSRREYLSTMQQHYKTVTSRSEKTEIINEVVRVLDYHRKYVTAVLNQLPASPRPSVKRHRPLKYIEALPVIQLVWEALDYPCAERLHPVLLSTSEILAKHNEVFLTEEILEQLSQISRATLARRLNKWCSPKRALPRFKPNSKIKTQVPIDIYAWDEDKPGALEIDLVEHNGGSSLGHFAYTLNTVDIVSGYSRRRAVLGRGQRGVFEAIKLILSQWPFTPWALHSDSGSEFLSGHLVRFCKEYCLEFSRSRPYQKNDNAHVEQKNRQFVREIVGYERYDTTEDVTWLNEVYGLLDVYVNLFLPMRKVVFKERQGAKVRKRYDIARTPFQRLLEKDVLNDGIKSDLLEQHQSLNPLALHRELEGLLSLGPAGAPNKQENGPSPKQQEKEEAICW